MLPPSPNPTLFIRPMLIGGRPWPLPVQFRWTIRPVGAGRRFPDRPRSAASSSADKENWAGTKEESPDLRPGPWTICPPGEAPEGIDRAGDCWPCSWPIPGGAYGLGGDRPGRILGGMNRTGHCWPVFHGQRRRRLEPTPKKDHPRNEPRDRTTGKGQRRKHKARGDRRHGPGDSAERDKPAGDPAHQPAVKVR